jgi:hypothetical protein
MLKRAMVLEVADLVRCKTLFSLFNNVTDLLENLKRCVKKGPEWVSKSDCFVLVRRRWKV